MRIKLTCLSCGHLFELGDAYESYTGEIRCWGCRAMLDISLLEGKLQSMKLHDETQVVLVRPAPAAPPVPPAAAPGIEVLILPQAMPTMPAMPAMPMDLSPAQSRSRRKAR
jgi:hypothetical protein